jgi:hypothetical protein
MAVLLEVAHANRAHNQVLVLSDRSVPVGPDLEGNEIEFVCID